MYALLLQMSQIEGKFGDIVTKTFNPAYYLLLAKNHIENIGMEIKMDQNELVNFTYRKVILTLHFRLVKLQKFAEK